MNVKIKISLSVFHGGFILQGGTRGVEPVWQEIFRSRDDNLPLQNERNADVINNTRFPKPMWYSPIEFPRLVYTHNITRQTNYYFPSVISYYTYGMLYPETPDKL